MAKNTSIGIYQFHKDTATFRLLAILLFLAISNFHFSQTDTSVNTKPEIHFNGFLDVFYVYDFNKPNTTFRQPFLYNHNRHNEFNLNLGFIGASLTHAKYRANLALHAGTYVNDNYTNEPSVLKNIFEANAGFALTKNNKLWVDAGIFTSHIGFESAMSLDNWTLTRSLLAENSPYYLTGAKISYSPSNKLEMLVMICNGWQRIQRVAGNSLPALSTQIKINPTKNVVLNWSTFVGTDDSDLNRRMRYFNNLYGQFAFSEKFGLIAGFDFGIQQRARLSPNYSVWLSPVMIVRYAFTKKWSTSFRAEYYQDADGVLINSRNLSGFRTTGMSLNVDYSPAERLLWRLEGRWLHSENLEFRKGNRFVKNNLFISTSIAILFGK